MRWLDARRGVGDHLPLNVFIHYAIFQEIGRGRIVDTAGDPFPIFAEIEPRSFNKVDAVFSVVFDEADRPKHRAHHLADKLGLLGQHRFGGRKTALHRLISITRRDELAKTLILRGEGQRHLQRRGIDDFCF